MKSSDITIKEVDIFATEKEFKQFVISEIESQIFT
jgi:hypothetical protein